MNRLLTTAAALLALGVLEPTRADALVSPSPMQAGPSQPVRYVRAKDGGAKLYNLPDKNAVVVGSAAGKGLLAVYGERAGFLSVEVPGGVEVWVYGEYAKPTDQPGTVEITGSGVRMRPLAQSDEKSFPLDLQLHKGDRVKVVGRTNPSKPIEKDWLKIVSPAGAHVWTLAADTQTVGANEDVHAAWDDAVKAALAGFVAYDLGSAQDRGATGTATAGATKSGETQDASFDEAQKLYDAARTAPRAPVGEWVAVREAYQRYLDKNPQGALVPKAKEQIEKVKLHEDIARLQVESEKAGQNREEELKQAKARLKEVEDAQGPLWGRFQARGWLERQSLPGETPRWLVRWADKPSAELVCSSGRFDLSVFEKCEIGVMGKIVRNPVEASAATSARPARIDVTRIEVLATHTEAR